MAEWTLNAGLGTPLQQLLMADSIVPGQEPSYQLCKVIYQYHPLGQKMAESPIGMAQFKPREITVPEGPEEDVKKAFVEEWKALQADKVIYNLASLARVYGVSSLALLSEGVPVNRPIDYKTLWDAKIAFSVFDPLNTAGSLVLNQNPLAMDFLKYTDIHVSGAEFNRGRSIVLMNEQPIYLGYTNSAFGYVGRSVYQRALFPLKSFIGTMQTDDLISQKAGLLIAKMKQAGSIVDNLMKTMFGLKRQQLKEGQTYGVLGISTDEDIESLNLQNVDGAGGFARKNILENIAVAADMPAKLLNAETFAEGFGEGTEDAKNVARYIDRVRTWMEPAYTFMDKVVMYRAWNPNFYEIIQEKYPEYRKRTHAQAFYQWRNCFAAQWPDLLTEPKSEQAKSDKVRLEAIEGLLEILLPIVDKGNKAVLVQWAADNFNSLETLFDTPLELNYEDLAEYEPAQGNGEMPGAPHVFGAQDSVKVRRLLKALTSANVDLKRLAGHA